MLIASKKSGILLCYFLLSRNKGNELEMIIHAKMNNTSSYDNMVVYYDETNMISNKGELIKKNYRYHSHLNLE